MEEKVGGGGSWNLYSVIKGGVIRIERPSFFKILVSPLFCPFLY